MLNSDFMLEPVQKEDGEWPGDFTSGSSKDGIPVRKPTMLLNSLAVPNAMAESRSQELCT